MTIWQAERPVGDLRPGDHAWLAYHNREEQDHVIGDYVLGGLNSPERVVYVTDARPWQLPGMLNRFGIDPSPYVEAGKLRLIPRDQACMTRGLLDPDRLVETLRRELSLAFEQGLRGVRFTADLGFVLHQPGGRQALVACEQAFDRTVAPSTMTTAICQIDRSHCTDEDVIALQNTHEVLVEANPDFDDGVLRIVRTFQPCGIRIEGELDTARKSAFEAALNRAMAHHREVHLDFRRLEFIDFASLDVLIFAAMRMRPGHSLILDHLSPDTAELLTLVGYDQIPGVRRGLGGNGREWDGTW